MHARFYAPDARSAGDLVALPGEEAEHASRVLRLRPGDAVVVFNGRGQAFDATIESVRRDGVRARIGPPRGAAPEARTAITLVQAVLKGDKMDDVVRDAVMIGVTAIQPVLTARTEVSAKALERSGRRERWQRVAVSSAKQCGRAVVPPVMPPEPFESTVTRWKARESERPVVMFVEPGASAQRSSLSAIRTERLGGLEADVVIGPEGGWAPEEIAMAEQSCRLVTLGGRTIRGDAMALMAVTALFVVFGEYE